MKKGRGYQFSMGESSINGVLRTNITHLLFNFKQDIINNMTTYLDTLQENKKHEEAKEMLVEYCPHCRQKKGIQMQNGS